MECIVDIKTEESFLLLNSEKRGVNSDLKTTQVII